MHRMGLAGVHCDCLHAHPPTRGHPPRITRRAAARRLRLQIDAWIEETISVHVRLRLDDLHIQQRLDDEEPLSRATKAELLGNGGEVARLTKRHESFKLSWRS